MGESRLITHEAQVTPRWLTDVLAPSGRLDGEVASVSVRARRETGYHVVLWLDVDYSRPAELPARLVLKFSQDTRATRVPETGREVAFYNEIARHMGAGPAVTCYDAVYSAAAGRLHVLMDDLSGTHYAQAASHVPPTQPECFGIVDALARLHAFWWGRPPFDVAGSHVVDDAEIGARVLENSRRMEAFATMLGDRLSANRRAIIRTVLAGMPRLFRRLSCPFGMSVVHSDVHVGNFLYPREPAAHAVAIIDWQTWNVDLAVRDLAQMMAYFWFPEHRGQHEVPLLRRYHRGLQALGIENYTWEAMFDDYRLCVIRLLFHPAWQWQNDEGVSKAWFHFERIMLAYQDLHCEELLGT
jgi:Ser/Thr protein kinase RdoA (MazF antagonist)